MSPGLLPIPAQSSLLDHDLISLLALLEHRVDEETNRRDERKLHRHRQDPDEHAEQREHDPEQELQKHESGYAGE